MYMLRLRSTKESAFLQELVLSTDTLSPSPCTGSDVDKVRRSPEDTFYRMIVYRFRFLPFGHAALLTPFSSAVLPTKRAASNLKTLETGTPKTRVKTGAENGSEVLQHRYGLTVLRILCSNQG